MEQLIDKCLVALVLIGALEPLGNHNRGQFLGLLWCDVLCILTKLIQVFVALLE